MNEYIRPKANPIDINFTAETDQLIAQLEKEGKLIEGQLNYCIFKGAYFSDDGLCSFYFTIYGEGEEKYDGVMEVNTETLEKYKTKYWSVSSYITKIYEK